MYVERVFLQDSRFICQTRHRYWHWVIAFRIPTLNEEHRYVYRDRTVINWQRKSKHKHDPETHKFTDSIRETPMKRDVLEVVKTTEVFVDYDDTYLHFSTSKTFFPGENGTYLQPTSRSPKNRDNFLQNYPDIHKGLGGRKLKNWLVRTRPTDIVHVVDNLRCEPC